MYAENSQNQSYLDIVSSSQRIVSFERAEEKDQREICKILISTLCEVILLGTRRVNKVFVIQIDKDFVRIIKNFDSSSNRNLKIFRKYIYESHNALSCVLNTFDNAIGQDLSGQDECAGIRYSRLFDCRESLLSALEYLEKDVESDKASEESVESDKASEESVDVESCISLLKLSNFIEQVEQPSQMVDHMEQNIGQHQPSGSQNPPNMNSSHQASDDLQGEMNLSEDEILLKVNKTIIRPYMVDEYSNLDRLKLLKSDLEVAGILKHGYIIQEKNDIANSIDELLGYLERRGKYNEFIEWFMREFDGCKQAIINQLKASDHIIK